MLSASCLINSWQVKKTLAERDEVIAASTKKIKSMEKDVEECSAKLSSKDVEILTMELEIEEYKMKFPDMKVPQAVLFIYLTLLC